MSFWPQVFLAHWVIEARVRPLNTLFRRLTRSERVAGGGCNRVRDGFCSPGRSARLNGRLRICDGLICLPGWPGEAERVDNKGPDMPGLGTVGGRNGRCS